jgi:predicted RNase H-like HicB family nuclease
MKASYTYWEVPEGGFIGFINQYPDYWTQGETIAELEAMLQSLYHDIVSFDDIRPPAHEYTGTLLLV